MLDVKGLVKKVHGGAVKREIALPPEPSFDEKKLIASKEKEIIARYAAENFINDGNIVSLGAGSTILKMMPYLIKKNITLLTIGLQNILYALKFAPQLNIIASGGSLRHPALAYVGPIAEEFFRKYKTDLVFLSGTGLTIKDGIMDPHPLDVEIKKIMTQNAKKVVFLMDSSKINQISLATSINLEDIDILITDDGAPDDFRKEVKKLNIDVRYIAYQ